MKRYDPLIICLLGWVKQDFLGLGWSRVVVYFKSVGMLPVILIPKRITGSILKLLQYTMTLLQGFKDPVLTTLMFIERELENGHLV